MLEKYCGDGLLHLYATYMNHRMQITQEHSEYDLTTNSVKFRVMQHNCTVRR